MLANKVDPPAAVNLAKGLTDALEDPQKEDCFWPSSFGEALTALATKLDSSIATDLAKGLAAALENPQDTNPGRLSGLGTVAGIMPINCEKSMPNNYESIKQSVAEHPLLVT